MQRLVIAGIGTEIGKSLISAILCQKLRADYWKPIQAGNLEFTDADFVRSVVPGKNTSIHSESYLLELPMSPHAAANRENKEIQLANIIAPDTQNGLIVELAGGVMVPLNSTETNLDLMKQLNYDVVLVSNYYLGSINHTLLTYEILRSNNVGLKGIIFNGDPNFESRDIILKMTGLPLLGEIPQLDEINEQSLNSAGDKIMGFE